MTDFVDQEVIAWNLVSFWAAPPEQQLRLIGKCEPWFVAEDESINPGANYLCGVANATVEYIRCFVDAAAGVESLLRHLSAYQRDHILWGTKKLVLEEDGRKLRVLANDLLHSLGLPPHLPDTPFLIEELIETDGCYQQLPLPDMRAT